MRLSSWYRPDLSRECDMYSVHSSAAVPVYCAPSTASAFRNSATAVGTSSKFSAEMAHLACFCAWLMSPRLVAVPAAATGAGGGTAGVCTGAEGAAAGGGTRGAGAQDCGGAPDRSGPVGGGGGTNPEGSLVGIWGDGWGGIWVGGGGAPVVSAAGLWFMGEGAKGSGGGGADGPGGK